MHRPDTANFSKKNGNGFAQKELNIRLNIHRTFDPVRV